ncbi:MAG: hypothetical protein K6E85_09560 [Lachnospiraceae bacterium]|nr:hypothetical protein [Lachnospiraceae bacterium]
MKKTTKRILSVLLIIVMMIVMIGCKKKDDSANKGNGKTQNTDIVEPSTESVPAVTMEDLFEIQKENTEKYSKLMKTVSSEQKIEIPDSNVYGDIVLKFSLDLMGSTSGNFDIKGNFDFMSFANIAHFVMDMDVDGNMNGEQNTNKKQLEMYLDNSGDDDTIRIYESEEEGVWKLIEKSLKEMIEQYGADGQTSDAGNAAGSENPEERKYFKDLEDFLKKHTVMEEVQGAFRNTTTFTVPEFRVYYRNDINAAINELTDKVKNGMDGLSIAGGANTAQIMGVVASLFNEVVNGMTGEIRIIQDFNTELEPTVLTLEVNKLDVTTTSNLKLKFNVEGLSVKLTNREDKVPVEIPENVKDNAVSESSPF